MAIKIPGIQQQAWTDSTIVLYWLASHPSRWETFVAHRVAEIHETLQAPAWRHIESAQNPADCASRGLNRQDLEKHNLWWYGPSFLSQTEKNWPSRKDIAIPENGLEEKQKCFSLVCDETNISTVIPRFSNFERLIRCLSICLRWHPKNQYKNHISPQEMSNTEKIII